MTSALLQTVHGSHLYGLAHENSDIDIFRVRPEWNRARKNDVYHNVLGKIDVTIIGLSTWLRFCDEGVPQALEAMFSPVATIDQLGQYRAAYRVDTDKVRRTYMRTAKNFALSDDPKKQRHALRLLINLHQANRTGRFNPRLNPAQLVMLDALMSDPVDSYDMLKRSV